MQSEQSCYQFARELCQLKNGNVTRSLEQLAPSLQNICRFRADSADQFRGRHLFKEDPQEQRVGASLLRLALELVQVLAHSNGLFQQSYLRLKRQGVAFPQSNNYFQDGAASKEQQAFLLFEEMRQFTSKQELLGQLAGFQSRMSRLLAADDLTSKSRQLLGKCKTIAQKCKAGESFIAIKDQLAQTGQSQGRVLEQVGIRAKHLHDKARENQLLRQKLVQMEQEYKEELGKLRESIIQLQLKVKSRAPQEDHSRCQREIAMLREVNQTLRKELEGLLRLRQQEQRQAAELQGQVQNSQRNSQSGREQKSIASLVLYEHKQVVFDAESQQQWSGAGLFRRLPSGPVLEKYYRSLGTKLQLQYRKACLDSREVLFRTTLVQVGVITTPISEQKVEASVIIKNLSRNELGIGISLANYGLNAIPKQRTACRVPPAQHARFDLRVQRLGESVGTTVLLLSYGQQKVTLLLPISVLKFCRFQDPGPVPREPGRASYSYKRDSRVLEKVSALGELWGGRMSEQHFVTRVRDEWTGESMVVGVGPADIWVAGNDRASLLSQLVRILGAD